MACLVTKPNFCCVCLNRLPIERRRKKKLNSKSLAVQRDVIQQLLGMNLQSFPALNEEAGYKREGNSPNFRDFSRLATATI